MSPAANAPLPFTDDFDSGGFWKAAAEGTLALRSCSNCQKVLHLPKLYCDNCDSWDTEWREFAPTGTLYTWTVAVQQLHAAFPTPYTVVLVEVDGAEGARLLGYLAGTPELEVGMAMHADFVTVEPGVTLVQWTPTPKS